MVEREEAPVALADVVERVEEAPERGEVRSFVATVDETLAATAPVARNTGRSAPWMALQAAETMITNPQQPSLRHANFKIFHCIS